VGTQSGIKGDLVTQSGIEVDVQLSALISFVQKSMLYCNIQLHTTLHL
jgi:hypothetical protein